MARVGKNGKRSNWTLTSWLHKLRRIDLQRDRLLGSNWRITPSDQESYPWMRLNVTFMLHVYGGSQPSSTNEDLNLTCFKLNGREKPSTNNGGNPCLPPRRKARSGRNFIW